MSSLGSRIRKRMATLAALTLPAVASSPVLHSGAAWSQVDLSEMGFDGFASASEDILVSAYESGRLETLLVGVGDQVSAGQVVATLDDRQQVLAASAAEVLAKMRGALDAAAADKLMNETRLSQIRSLAGKGLARPEELTRAEIDFEMAKARWLAAKEEITHREIEWSRATEQVRRRQVTTPISGVVAKTFVHPGEFVSPSDLTVVQVINQETLVALFNVPSSDAAGMRLGQEMKVEFVSLSASTIGKIETMAPMIDGESGTVAVSVRIDNSNGRWMAGDRCLLEPHTDRKESKSTGQVGDLLPRTPVSTVANVSDLELIVVAPGSPDASESPAASELPSSPFPFKVVIGDDKAAVSVTDLSRPAGAERSVLHVHHPSDEPGGNREPATGASANRVEDSKPMVIPYTPRVVISPQSPGSYPGKSKPWYSR
jgi:RND family efflux transporter MFP subunit